MSERKSIELSSVLLTWVGKNGQKTSDQPDEKGRSQGPKFANEVLQAQPPANEHSAIPVREQLMQIAETERQQAITIALRAKPGETGAKI
jgi:hypothetical protein